MNMVDVFKNIIDFACKFPSIVFAMLAVFPIAWYIKSFRKVTILEKRIFEKQGEYDDMEQTMHVKMKGMISQGQLDALVVKNRKPIEKELNLLKMERRFILDKLSLVGLFKRG